MRGIGTKQRVIYWLFAGLLLPVFGGCTPAPFTVPTPEPVATASVEAPLFVSAAAATALPQLVDAERTAAHDRNLALLMTLWAEDGRVIDGKQTIESSDDYQWIGRAAILDRYQVAVFPNPPSLRQSPPQLAIKLEGQHAYAVDPENQDQWEFSFREGRWWLLVLRYSFSTP